MHVFGVGWGVLWWGWVGWGGVSIGVPQTLTHQNAWGVGFIVAGSCHTAFVVLWGDCLKAQRLLTHVNNCWLHVYLSLTDLNYYIALCVESSTARSPTVANLVHVESSTDRSPIVAKADT